MKIEIDVSGEDIFNHDYVICISDGIGNIMGFKFNVDLVNKLNKNWRDGKYNRFPWGSLGKFKVRIYRVVLRYLLRSLFKKNKDKEVTVQFCRDFPSHEKGIAQSIQHRVVNIHKRDLKRIFCEKLPKNSDAHGYAFIMHKDKYNYLNCYTKISLKDIEHGLIFHTNNNKTKKV